jgi:hypothetical protein
LQSADAAGIYAVGRSRAGAGMAIWIGRSWLKCYMIYSVIWCNINIRPYIMLYHVISYHISGGFLCFVSAVRCPVT